MSGGSLNYVHEKVEEAAAKIRTRGGVRELLFDSFADHLDAVADALQDVELVLSGDYGPDGADDSIREVFETAGTDRQMRAKLLELAKRIVKELE